MAQKKKKENKKQEELETIPQDAMIDDYGEILADWDFPEFEKPKRSRKWYFWGLIILLFDELRIEGNFNFKILFFIILFWVAYLVSNI